MTRIALIGMGKMGRAIESLASSRECEIVSTIDPHIGAAVSVSVESLNGADVAIEFTSPESAAANVRACLAARCPVVVGTTGWYDELPAMRAEVAAMQGAYSTASDSLVAVIGPSIGPDAYTVGAEVVGAFSEAYPDDRLFRTDERGTRLDLWEANTRQFVRAGVRPEAISCARVCTLANGARFFSHRYALAHDEPEGRFAVLLAMEG